MANFAFLNFANDIVRLEPKVGGQSKWYNIGLSKGDVAKREIESLQQRIVLTRGE